MFDIVKKNVLEYCVLIDILETENYSQEYYNFFTYSHEHYDLFARKVCLIIMVNYYFTLKNFEDYF